MLIKKLINDVVKCENIVITTYPQWSDYGCLTNAIEIVTKDSNGDFVENYYVTEELQDGDPAYDLTIGMIDNLEEEKKNYEKFLLNKRIKKSKELGHSYLANIGDIVEVYKGRKYTKGEKFTITGEYIYKDIYNRAVASYWKTTSGRFVLKQNCVIVGSIKL